MLAPTRGAPTCYNMYMEFLENVWNKARKLEKRIVLPETEDIRVLKATELITKSNIAKIILVGDSAKIKKLAKENDLDISKAQIVEPTRSEKLDLYVEMYINKLKKRGKDVSTSEVKDLLSNDYPFFGAMMVEAEDADGMVSGADHATAHTIKATIYSVGLKENIKTLSSFFVMILPNNQFGVNGVLFYADCGVVPEPTQDQLCDIAVCTAGSFRQLMNKEPKIAMLSFSTKGSGKSPSAEKVANATKTLQEKYPDLMIDGEMQADAALIPAIGKSKAPDSKVAGKANVLIFPDLGAGNIAYKLTERLAGATALGPIFQGCAKPINDLSRGCSVDDIVNITAITAIQCE